jgi:5-methyltetrahydrofolate--homocysteine methyltransferase
MIIIGELINSTRRKVGDAIAARDAALIQELAVKQAEAGADYLDVNAGARVAQEAEDMAWLVETVQAVTSLPLCIDSPSAAVIETGLARHRGQALVNSFSAEPERRDAVLSLAARQGARAVGLTMDQGGMPETCQQRVEIALTLVAAAAEHGIATSDVFIDPLVRPISSEPDQGRAVLDAISAIKRESPEVNVSVGLSNVSFGLPDRRLVNRTFLAMAVAAGVDAALIDPLDRRLMACLRAAEALIGRDDYCADYLAAYRSGAFDD